MKAKACRFYGWTDTEVKKMKLGVFMEYFKSIRPLQAEESKLFARTSSFPHMKEAKRTKNWNDWDRVINKSVETHRKPLTMEEGANILAGKMVEDG